MKALAVLSLILLAGCEYSGSREAAYVRDKSHHCRVIGRDRGSIGWDSFEHKPKKLKGFVVYTCDDDISFTIYDSWEQP